MKHASASNPKIAIRKTGRYGKGGFAVKKIRAGEVISSFAVGETIKGQKELNKKNKDVRDHMIQCGKMEWRHSRAQARYFAHSCAPNAGIQNRFDIVAMRDILPGEEITWDYRMTEDSPWDIAACRCGAEECDGRIRGFKYLPEKKRKAYRGFISEWLVEKYNLKE